MIILHQDDIYKQTLEITQSKFVLKIRDNLFSISRNKSFCLFAHDLVNYILRYFTWVFLRENTHLQNMNAPSRCVDVIFVCDDLKNRRSTNSMLRERFVPVAPMQLYILYNNVEIGRASTAVNAIYIIMSCAIIIPITDQRALSSSSSSS